jgi:hypothetical protein
MAAGTTFRYNLYDNKKFRDTELYDDMIYDNDNITNIGEPILLHKPTRTGYGDVKIIDPENGIQQSFVDVTRHMIFGGEEHLMWLPFPEGMAPPASIHNAYSMYIVPKNSTLPVQECSHTTPLKAYKTSNDGSGILLPVPLALSPNERSFRKEKGEKKRADVRLFIRVGNAIWSRDLTIMPPQVFKPSPYDNLRIGHPTLSTSRVTSSVPRTSPPKVTSSVPRTSPPKTRTSPPKTRTSPPKVTPFVPRTSPPKVMSSVPRTSPPKMHHTSRSDLALSELVSALNLYSGPQYMRSVSTLPASIPRISSHTRTSPKSVVVPSDVMLYTKQKKTYSPVTSPVRTRTSPVKLLPKTPVLPKSPRSRTSKRTRSQTPSTSSSSSRTPRSSSKSRSSSSSSRTPRSSTPRRTSVKRGRGSITRKNEIPLPRPHVALPPPIRTRVKLPSSRATRTSQPRMGFNFLYEDEVPPLSE